jgi:hypothetical protein
MRRSPIAALAFAFTLAACSGGEDAETDEGLEADDVMAATAGADLIPGQYESRGTLLAFEVPGVPDSQIEPVRAMMAESMGQTHSYCLTQEEIDQGPGQMAQKMAESNCSVEGLRASGGVISGEMQCSGEDGLKGTVKLEGTMNGNSSTMTMETIQSVPGIAGEGARLKMQVEATRVGECAGGTGQG